jgi:type IV secretory pathway VirB4 component
MPIAGAYLGIDVLTGGEGFAFDPFEAYARRLITNPNVVIAGEPGTGKSAMVKCLLSRSSTLLKRWVAIADPKGEYGVLAERLGLTVIALSPGGATRLNPLDPGPVSAALSNEEVARRQASMVTALLGVVMKRDLSPIEDAAIGWATLHLSTARCTVPTLLDLVSVLSNPSVEMAARARLTPHGLASAIEATIYGLGKLIDRSLRGMFDGPTNLRLDWSGPGVVLDLSAVHHDAEALTLVMLAATAWLQVVLSESSERPKIQLLDEAWSLLASERTSRYLQACWKLGRSYGVSNIAVVHRMSDLRAQADDGTVAAKVSMGLLADTQTRVLFRQSSDQVAEATDLLGLTSTEESVLGRLCRGRAIWKVGEHTSVVQHAIGPAEVGMCDTDQQMNV